MRILIFGGNGFVGKNLTQKIKRIHEIFIPSRKIEKPLKDQSVNYLKFDIEKNIQDIKPDIIINLIGILKENKETTYEKTHIETVEKILYSMQKNKIKKIIHISALGVHRGCNSRYFKTKEIAEDMIIKSGIDYLIIRPPIMTGDGQKLNEELKNLSKLTPIILVPKAITRICLVDETIKEILEGIKGKKGLIEIKGKRTTYKELFQEILKNIGKKRIILEIPIKLFIPVVILSSFLRNPPITTDTYKMLLCSNRIYG